MYCTDRSLRLDVDFEFEVKPLRELYLLRGSLARAPPLIARVAAASVRFEVSPLQKPARDRTLE
ncbi:hypothetical protein D0A34_25970 [Microcoleus vaginatus PCC 9802]|nr:hypothetical protein D0A34_25970 [Microcoleus vaginatus PCC 9802]